MYDCHNPFLLPEPIKAEHVWVCEHDLHPGIGETHELAIEWDLDVRRCS